MRARSCTPAAVEASEVLRAYRSTLCIKRFVAYRVLGRVERVFEQVGVNFVDAFEEGARTGVGRRGAEDELDACRPGRTSSSEVPRRMLWLDLAVPLTGESLHAGHLEVLSFHGLQTSSCRVDGREPRGDGVNAMERAGQDEVVVGGQGSETWRKGLLAAGDALVSWMLGGRERSSSTKSDRRLC